jgi:hypothetical protein
LAIKKEFIGDEVNDMHLDEKGEMIWAKIEIVGSKTLYYGCWVLTRFQCLLQYLVLNFL